MFSQNDLERIKDRLQRGLITSAQANVEIVKVKRFKLVTSKVPRDVRSALNSAVKAGELGHYKKDGGLPEAYFHPKFDHLARAARTAHAQQAASALHLVCR